MSKFTTAYKEELQMPPSRWLLFTLVITIATVLLEAALILWQPRFFDTPFILYPFLALAAVVGSLLLFYPLFRWEQRGSDIDREMHLFITRMGVLAASESARKEMFDILARMREYRSLAVEINKIFIMVDKWNVSLERSCRFVAQTTPSDLLSDFLNRLAHAVEGGEPAEVFFQTEQVVVMNQYSLKYQSAMTTVEWMKEIYISLVIAVLFILVFATLAPFLTRGEDPNLWLGFAIGVFVAVEILTLAVLNVVVPGESIWHNMAIQTPVHVLIRRSLWASFLTSLGFLLIAAFIPGEGPGSVVLLLAWALSIILMAVSLIIYPQWQMAIFEGMIMAAILVTVFFSITFLTEKLYLPLALAYILSPWIIPGHYVNTEEGKIKRRDENFSAFLRSLGAAVATTSKDMTVPLGKLRRHDFGPLTKNVDDLYKRLSLRILRAQAWEYYSAETLSELISKFTEMYVEGIKAGGNPKKVSQIISDNFLKIVGLRKMKYDSASTLTGILYGLAFAISFVLYLTFIVMRNFDQLALGLTQSLQQTGGSIVTAQSLMILNPGAFNFDILGGAILLLLMIHAMVSALMTQVISGSHKAGAAWHFVILVWIAALVAVAVLESSQILLPVSSL